MKLISIKDIMVEYNVGRATATAWAAQSGAALPRTKYQTYRLDRDRFEARLKRRVGK